METVQSFFRGPTSEYLGSAQSTELNASLVPSGHPASSNTSGLKTQLAISTLLGLSSFLTFCFLRTRWTILYAPRSKLRRHTPPVLSSTFFGWIPQLLRIPEAELIECVGLDAAMMLRFFTMSLKLFAACMIPGLLIILPINIYSASEGRLPTDPDEDNEFDPSLPNAAPRHETSLLYLFAQFTFTWVFSLLTIYVLWRTYEGYIDIRRRYLLKRRKAIVNRTIMVVGLPSHLRNDRALATFYESLGVGTVESAHVCRHVTGLKRLIEQRAYALRALEQVYTEYYGNPSSDPDYDPEAIAAENDHTLDHGLHAAASAAESSHDPTRGYFPHVGDCPSSMQSNDRTKKRPTIRLGFLGLFGKEVDKIDYCREVFATLDKAVQKMRLSRVFATTSIGFVTFEEMHAAQILAQTVNTQETLSCETFLAPEPRDVYWDNLNLPPSELDVRTVVINVITFSLVFFWAGPVGVFSSFLSLDSLNKVFPGISKLAGKHRLLKSLIQGFLPTVGVIVFLAVVPRILLALCRRQGIQSRSEIAQSLYNKYFMFILFNVVLVFTIIGTWSQAINKVYHNIGELTLLLAASLPRVAPFFVNYIILRGIGLLPLQLLQVADVFILILQNFISRTPRDYAEARAPPELPYGVVYANATLVFVVLLIYSCMQPLILVFGVIYFALGYLVIKWTAKYMPLELLRPAHHMGSFLGHFEEPMASPQQEYSDDSSPLTASGLDVTGPGSGLGQVAVDMDPKESLSKQPLDISRLVAGMVVTTPDGLKRRVPKTVVDDDEYQAIPDRFTDYQQPPMTLYPGVLNSGMRHYCHPAIAGALPTLWLPLRKNESDGRGKGPASHYDESNDFSDQMRGFDEGDNMAGGVQDDDDDDLISFSDEWQGNGSTGLQDQDRNGYLTIVEEITFEDDIEDGSSDITGGPSSPALPPTNDPPTSGALRRNPAVEGISDVYYHHPERRSSNASSTSAIRNLSAAAKVDACAELKGKFIEEPGWITFNV
ncbi:hypothetical protein BGZ54_009420 [Gamsiella multidivaricata]|nr:hypothetical protein BGZ54_009420 [Gamsiella multidivaricata]